MRRAPPVLITIDQSYVRVARAQETNGPPLFPYTGRGAKTVWLVSDRTNDQLQHPLFREDLARQSFFRHRRLIEDFEGR
jgi:hypothetical protein